MTNLIKHTFVICAYKESPYLEACIKSLLLQTSVKEKISTILIYTSTPNKYISSIATKYNLAVHTGIGGGIGNDWNNALSATNTKYVTIAHQDDIYDPLYGKRILELFNSKENINLVFSDYYEIDENDERRKRNINLKIKTLALRILSLSDNKKYQRRIYAFGNFICCPAVSYNMEKLSDFKFDNTLKMAVDWDAWERIMKRSGFIRYIPERLMAHRIHSESETTNNTIDKNREKEEYDMFRRYWGENITKILMNFYTNNQKGNEEH
ncbi:glycosyltransferase family 2 protein [Lactococcus cremoris]|nr:glycosyltransferase [Lactococcus cremoris]